MPGPGTPTCLSCTPSPLASNATGAAVDAALTLPHHNGRTEGVNNKIKLLKRQTYRRAGYRLLRHLTLLN
ncbi:transposase [Streptomyces violascens]|uniref:transposase n=1 Tax=Streptomyces violascens TaxID=67381 RepID=UPI00368EC8F5